MLAHDQDTIGYDLLVVQTLIGIDARNRLIPVLVTRIPTAANGDVSKDGLRITYHLRHGIRFADGTPLRSSDVAFTFRAILDSRNNVLSQDAYRRVAALQTPDPYTVRVLLHRRWNAAVSELFAQSDFAFGILPAHAFPTTELAHAAWEQHPFGSGPFRVAQWRRGDRVVLVPNPYFRPRPKLDRIILQMIPSETSGFVALRTHEVDVGRLEPEMLGQAEATPGLTILRTPENATQWLTLQMSRGATRSARVREAIAYALDLRALRKAFEGVYPQAGSFLPPVLPWHDAAIRPYPHDLARARQLLRGMHASGVLVYAIGNPVYQRLATIVQEQLARAGMDLTVKPYPLTLFNAPDGPVRNARFTVAIDGWLGGADPEQSIVFTCAQANVDGNNIARFCDRDFDRLAADQETTTVPSRRAQDFSRMQQVIHDTEPVLPLYYETYFDGLGPGVRGFRRNMLRYPVAPETWDVSR